MINSSPWSKLLAPLGIACAVVLLVAAGALWLAGSGTATGDGGMGELVAVAQAARAQARAALAGDSAAFDRVVATREELKSDRAALVGDQQAAAVRQFAADGATGRRRGSAGSFTDRAAGVGRVERRARPSLEAGPATTCGDRQSRQRAGAGRPRDQSAVSRTLRADVEAIQQNLRSLGSGQLRGRRGAAASATRQQFLAQIIRGLRGEDQSLGMAPARGQAAQTSLEAASRLFEQVRKALGVVVAGAAQLTTAEQAVAMLDVAADGVLDRYRGVDLGGATSGDLTWRDRLPVLLVVAGLLMVVLMLLLYYRSRDSAHGRRAASGAERTQPAGDPAAARRAVEPGGRRSHRAGHGHRRHHRRDRRLHQLRDRCAARPRCDDQPVGDSARRAPRSRRRPVAPPGQGASGRSRSRSPRPPSRSARMAASTEEVSGNAERCCGRRAPLGGGRAQGRRSRAPHDRRHEHHSRDHPGDSKRIKRLGESSQEIGNIVELINDIAEQTNILALNASIQASMAGEAGRGFAVVADEVQRLAERAANATKQIEVLVRTIQTDTNEAVVSMERSTTDVVGGALLAENAGAALEEIEQVSNQIASLVQNISGSSRAAAASRRRTSRATCRCCTKISSQTAESTSGDLECDQQARGAVRRAAQVASRASACPARAGRYRRAAGRAVRPAWRAPPVHRRR